MLQRLEDEGSTDSAVHYLLGLILSGRGARAEALSRLSRAAQLAPDFPLYQFRLAETLHMLGNDPREPLDRARALAPADPWVNNLEGQLRLEAGDPAGAVGPLSARARRRAAGGSHQPQPLRITRRSGRGAEALEEINRYVKDGGESARTANQRGNILVRTGDIPAAVREFETAIRLDPENPAYKENCAAACIELDMVHRAEELLAQVEPEHPSASVYNLLGQVAALKGERARAELAYDRRPGTRSRQPRHLREPRPPAQGEGETRRCPRPAPGSPRRPIPRTRAPARCWTGSAPKASEKIVCATCGREWWVPRELPPQPPSTSAASLPRKHPPAAARPAAKVYCVGCAAAHVRDMRFFCPDDDEILRLSDDTLRWLFARIIDGD